MTLDEMNEKKDSNWIEVKTGNEEIKREVYDREDTKQGEETERERYNEKEREEGTAIISKSVFVLSTCLPIPLI